MPKAKIEETILKCQTCNEPLHAKVLSQEVSSAGRTGKRHHQELFCPLCGQSGSAVKHFQQQKHEEKKITRAQI